MIDPQTAVEQLKNIGEKSAGWLHEVGIHTYADLEKAGAVLAYKILQHRFSGINILMLYALHGALKDEHWNSISPEEKTALKEAVSESINISFDNN